ncbi:iron-containing alcohol dehydrogenase [Parabacteroides bouchesdurhonensis]|uniref:iron-containing alcohol dehydrogenase n=1 Tax=Parabacteroides bouchesdurhonensis TaxID=1936995 RepID=UPI001F1863CF|nr:iron-containing alcohol dehydrogenase [Parabacteroides bouchesdurhonensis]
MRDFNFRNDTKLFFRNDIRETVSEITKDHKVMLVYGSGSIKQNGCHEDITRTLVDSGIPFIEYGGSSREFEKIEQGIRFAKTNEVTMIIGAGGASVMDSAKLMAFGFYHESDLWDYVKGKPSYGLKRLPLALIPTYPSSGSENGLGAVTVDSSNGDFGTAYGIPADYAILCPRYSLTLDKEMTTYTGLVTLVQLSACVLGDKNRMSYDAGISYIRNVLEATKTLQNNPDDLNARGIIMLGTSLSTSSRIGIGKEENFAYDIYELEFLPEKLFGGSYRRSLTSVFPLFLKVMGKHHAEDIRKYYADAFGFDSSIEESTRKLIGLFSDFGVEMRYEREISRKQVDDMPNGTVQR